MATYLRQRPPTWFAPAALLFAAWGVIGCYACFTQFKMGADAMGPASDYDRALYAALPGWYNYVYAVAVGSALAGAVALLRRSAMARPLFILSLIAVVVQFGYLFATTDLIAQKGASVLAFPAFILVVALLAVRLAGVARRRGWIS
ncbi:hypothetical protein [Sphingomonas sp.]|uniref:hypothetical protein n=1 Tax=Sphingomonas sp. TaxID=28214 RepID=UPI002C48C9BA|nr:hypothetical protein [Sphingomonas sp.]HWK36499.1 hypothetical protein [Sphingomonas sp.]